MLLGFDSLLVWASSEGSGETARMRRLAWTFAARIGDNPNRYRNPDSATRQIEFQIANSKPTSHTPAWYFFKHSWVSHSSWHLLAMQINVHPISVRYIFLSAFYTIPQTKSSAHNLMFVYITKQKQNQQTIEKFLACYLFIPVILDVYQINFESVSDLLNQLFASCSSDKTSVWNDKL